jgi:hypothetical protein
MRSDCCAFEMYAWSLVFGLEKKDNVALLCSGDRRNHGPRRVSFSNEAGSRDALKMEDSVIADAIAGWRTRFRKAC